MFNNNKINNSRYVKNARDAHIAFGANPTLDSLQQQRRKRFQTAVKKIKTAIEESTSWNWLRRY